MQSQEYASLDLRDSYGTLQGSVMLDTEDTVWAAYWAWRLGSHGYAVRNSMIDGKSCALLLHRELIGLRPGSRMDVDHRNGDKLNCRRCNLRLVTTQQNTLNLTPRRGTTSKYRGVSWHSQAKKWRAYATFQGKHYSAGLHDDEESANTAVIQLRNEIMGNQWNRDLLSIPAFDTHGIGLETVTQKR